MINPAGLRSRNLDILRGQSAQKSDRDLFLQAGYVEGLKTSATHRLHSASGGKDQLVSNMVAGKHEEALKAGIRRRSLKESASEDLIQMNHPCLQAGFSKPYRRLVYDRVANPARVLLVGK